MRENIFFEGSLIALILIGLVFSFSGIEKQASDIFLIVINVIAAVPLIRSLFESVKNRRLSVEFLAVSALIFSGLYGEWRSMAFINLMLSSARILAGYVENRGRSALESLVKLRPKTARVERSGRIVIVPAGEIKPDDLVVIAVGESAPADGIIERGEAEFDQSLLTGESEPVFRKTGDKIFSSTILVSGEAAIRVIASGKDSVLEKIIRLVEEAGRNKARIMGIADRFVSSYVIASSVAALLIYFSLGKTEIVLAFMLVVCADDIAVAVPLAFTAAIARAAKIGAIVKGGVFIEQLGKVRKIFFDKTGTLTEGRPEVSEIVNINAGLMAEIAAAVKSMALKSSHPTAKAIVEHLREIVPSPVDDFQEIPGRGMEAKWRGRPVIIGRLRHLEDRGISASDLAPIILQKGKSAVFVGWDGKLVGAYLINDKLRREAPKIIKSLRKRGIEVVMLTGDNEFSAKLAAKALDITDFRSALLPEDKIKIVSGETKKEPVAMVGDGINDAAALGAANVGIAMGGIGSDITIETSDVVLMKDNLSDIPELISISQKTAGIVAQNFMIWVGVNIVGIGLVFMGVLSPSGAAAYNFLTDFLPLFNSLRLFSFKLRR